MLLNTVNYLRVATRRTCKTSSVALLISANRACRFLDKFTLFDSRLGK